MTYIVGLTGGIGSGKSTITHLFQALGVAVVDADIVAREIVAKGEPLLLQIVEHFGQEVLTEEGELNRPILREKVFNNSEETKWLNQLLHPAIRERCLEQLAKSKAPYTLFVAPLLFENHLSIFCQSILVVDVKEEIQLARATARDKNKAALIHNIMQKQLSRKKRLSYATDIIENNLPLNENFTQLAKQVLQLHLKYLKVASTYIE